MPFVRVATKMDSLTVHDQVILAKDKTFQEVIDQFKPNGSADVPRVVRAAAGSPPFAAEHFTEILDFSFDMGSVCTEARVNYVEIVWEKSPVGDTRGGVGEEKATEVRCAFGTMMAQSHAMGRPSFMLEIRNKFSINNTDVLFNECASLINNLGASKGRG